MIRPFHPADAPAVIALWDAVGLIRPWNDPHRDIERKLSVDDDLFLVATNDDVLTGTVMAGYDGHRGWVNYLAVDPPRQGEGWGRRLMEEAEERLLALGCPKLNLQVRADDAAATGFYRSLGYSVDQVVSLGKRLIDDAPPHSGGRSQSSARTP